MFQILRLPKSDRFFFEIRNRRGQLWFKSELFESITMAKRGAEKAARALQRKDCLHMLEKEDGKWVLILNDGSGKALAQSPLCAQEDDAFRIAKGVDSLDLENVVSRDASSRD